MSQIVIANLLFDVPGDLNSKENLLLKLSLELIIWILSKITLMIFPIIQELITFRFPLFCFVAKLNFLYKHIYYYYIS